MNKRRSVAFPESLAPIIWLDRGSERFSEYKRMLSRSSAGSDSSTGRCLDERLTRTETSDLFIFLGVSVLSVTEVALRGNVRFRFPLMCTGVRPMSLVNDGPCVPRCLMSLD